MSGGGRVCATSPEYGPPATLSGQWVEDDFGGRCQLATRRAVQGFSRSLAGCYLDGPTEAVDGPIRGSGR